jgi:hypothetical protein
MAKRKKSGPPETVVALPRRPRVTSILEEVHQPREMLVSSDAPPKAVAFAHWQLFSPSERIGPIPKGASKLSLEKVIQALHDCEINVGLHLQSFCFCGVDVWIGDELNGLKAKGRMGSDKDGQWPADGALALWLHTTALRLWPGSEYEKRYGGRRAAGLRIG